MRPAKKPTCWAGTVRAPAAGPTPPSPDWRCLSFLGSGHTHLDGPYREDVRRGLEYLMRTQAADGNLGGHAAMFEFMYCHAMATCALSEAYGMTRDDRLREPVRRAIGYTLAAQDPKGGGWRYKPGDAGDTSQLGWQLMALKSAELAGIPIPERTRQGIIRYLQSVSAGQYGGRASYRPGEQTTRSMTAEALVCWQFLGLAREHPACNEAGDFLLGELPGEGTFNLYYWYYATLGMYQLQGDHWQRWNEALRDRPGQPPGQGRAAGGLLEYERPLGGLRRPRLHHGPGRPDAGGLLPLFSPLFGGGLGRRKREMGRSETEVAMNSATRYCPVEWAERSDAPRDAFAPRRKVR